MADDLVWALRHLVLVLSVLLWDQRPSHCILEVYIRWYCHSFQSILQRRSNNQKHHQPDSIFLGKRVHSRLGCIRFRHGNRPDLLDDVLSDRGLPWDGIGEGGCVRLGLHMGRGYQCRDPWRWERSSHPSHRLLWKQWWPIRYKSSSERRSSHTRRAEKRRTQHWANIEVHYSIKNVDRVITSPKS